MTSTRIAIITLFLLAAPYFLAERTSLRLGFNVFSAQQDVEIGKGVSKDAERNLRILNDSQINSYTNSLGRRLASRAPGEKYPYQFKSSTTSRSSHGSVLRKNRVRRRF